MSQGSTTKAIKRQDEVEPHAEKIINNQPRKINPIKNSIIQLSVQNLKAHQVKGRKARILSLDGIIDSRENSKQLEVNLKGQKKLQKLSMQWPKTKIGRDKMPLIFKKLTWVKALSLDSVEIGKYLAPSLYLFNAKRREMNSSPSLKGSGLSKIGANQVKTAFKEFSRMKKTLSEFCHWNFGY